MRDERELQGVGDASGDGRGGGARGGGGVEES